MSDTPIIDPFETELYERIKLLLFSVNLPVQRLEADIDDIGRFAAPDGRSPQLRLIEAMPPLTPAAEAIVRAMIRAYGIELFTTGSANAVLRAMIKAGPTRFAQTALTLDPDAPGPPRASGRKSFCSGALDSDMLVVGSRLREPQTADRGDPHGTGGHYLESRLGQLRATADG